MLPTHAAPVKGRPRASVGVPVRRGLLSVHIIVSVAWIGVDLCVLLLAVLGAVSSDATTQRSAYVVLGPIASLLLVPLPLLALVSGIGVALTTPWGLLRHYWVILSLTLTAIATAAVLFALRPRLISAAERARHATDPASSVGVLRQQVIVASSVALLVLCAVAVINVYKPWGRTSRARRLAATLPPGRTS